MNFENTGKVIMMVFDELQNDDKSTEIIDLIDGGESDAEITEGLKKGILRLKELGKEDVAKEIESLM